MRQPVCWPRPHPPQCSDHTGGRWWPAGSKGNSTKRIWPWRELDLSHIINTNIISYHISYYYIIIILILILYHIINTNTNINTNTGTHSPSTPQRRMGVQHPISNPQGTTVCNQTPLKQMPVQQSVWGHKVIMHPVAGAVRLTRVSGESWLCSCQSTSGSACCHVHAVPTWPEVSSARTSFLPRITGVVPTDWLTTQLPLAQCGMSLNMPLRSSSEP